MNQTIQISHPASQETDPLLDRLRYLRDILDELAAFKVQAMEGPLLLWRDKDNICHRHGLGQVTTVGRATDATISIPDLNLSREHFRIEHANGCLLLKDAHSRNGTFVNGNSTRLVERELRDGDFISAGNQVFVFMAHDPKSR
jgi:hypothetical protein